MKISLNWIRKYIDLPENITDEDIMKDLTLRTVEVESIEKTRDKFENIVIGKILEVKNHPENRAAQKALAYEVVKDLHGKEEAEKAKEISEKIFRGEETEEMPTAEVSSKNILDVMVESKQAPSKSEARRLIIQGGVSINNEKVTDPNFECPQEFILRKGKKSIIKVKIK